MASSYLFSLPMGNELPRLFHHLGPRYFSNFQSSPLVRFFTYEAATSLSIYLQSLIDAKRTPSPELSLLLKGAKDREGPGISEDLIVFALTPFGYQDGDGSLDSPDATVLNAALRRDRTREKARIKGDVVVVKPQCLDVSLWEIGGAAVPLRLIELSQVSTLILGDLNTHKASELPRSNKLDWYSFRQSAYQLAKFGRHGTNTWLRHSGFSITFKIAHN